MATSMATAASVPPALRAEFEAAGQGHVFQFIDRGMVTTERAEALLDSLSKMDVRLVNELFTATMHAQGSLTEIASASSLEPCNDVLRPDAAERASLWELGLDAIAANQAGVIILAGGQGTRLGSDAPKGEYDVSLLSHKPLFALQVQRVARIRALAAARVSDPSAVHLPIYVMTSPQTDTATRAFFAASGYFDYPAQDVMFFCQGTLPCLTFDGKIMLENSSTVACAPDGNGGIYRALHLSGAIQDMTRRGVKGVHVFAVDNAIVRAADPVFLGLCFKSGADVGSKVCAKSGPHEKVGVLCKRDGAYTVVEYSELDKATAELRTPSGELMYNTGNLCIHYYSTDFLMTSAAPATLPKIYHLAKKAIPYADPATGATMSKDALAAVHGAGVNTGIKLESFIFDVFPAARSMCVMDINRALEFSPVKNAPTSNEDSPVSARDAVLRAHTRACVTAGMRVATMEGMVVTLLEIDTAPFPFPRSHAVELSPLVSYAGEGVAELACVTSGKDIVAPALILAESERGSSAHTRAAAEGVNVVFV